MRLAVLFLIVTCWYRPLAAQAPATDAPAAVSFREHVAPILLQQCHACHSAREAKGGYQVTSYQTLLQPGDSEAPPITPGQPDESELFALIASEDESSRMPKDGDPLTAEQIALVRRWISEGAKFDGPDPQVPLASFVTRPPHPNPPAAYSRPVPITALAFSPDGQTLAVGGYHEVTLWNANTGELIRRVPNIDERTYGLAYNADGTLLAVASGKPGESGEVKLVQPADATLVKELVRLSDVAFAVAFHPAGNQLAAASADRTLRVFDVPSGEHKLLIEDHADWVLGIAWSPDGSRIASASRDKTAKVFNAATGEGIASYSGHRDQVFDVAFRADGKQVFSGGADRKVHVWNPDDGQKAAELSGFEREVLRLVESGGNLFSCSADRKLRQHRGDPLQPFKVYEGHSDEIYALAVHASSGRVASGDYTGTVRVWNAEDASPVVTFVAAPGYDPTGASAQANSP